MEGPFEAMDPFDPFNLAGGDQATEEPSASGIDLGGLGLEVFAQINETLDEKIPQALNASLNNETSMFNSSSSNETGFEDWMDQDDFNATLIPEESAFPTWSPSLSPSATPSANPTREPTMSPTWTPIPGTDTNVLVSTIEVYMSIFAGVMFLFCILRIRYPRYFNVRSWAPGLTCKIAQESDYGFISWAWKVFQVDEDDILEQCGMDALCFIRVLRMGRKLAFTGCIHACWLIPVYATAESSSETDYLTDSLVLISTAHLPTGSWRFLATVIGAYVIFGYSMWMMKLELQWYTKKRHIFLSQRRPRNYAVYVAGIPEELRSGKKLEEFFKHAGATSSVLEAHVTLACPELEWLVAQRDDVKTRLKHARAFEAINGTRKVQRRVNLPFWKSKGGRKGSSLHSMDDSGTGAASSIVATVDSINKLETKLRQLTKDIALAYQNIERSNDPLDLEEHRKEVMREIQMMRNAERAQNIATRERVHSAHGEVEEIFHVTREEMEQRNASFSRTKRTDQFSQVAERFFFGGLTPAQQMEQQRLIEQEEDPLRRVTIHTSQNSMYSETYSETSDDLNSEIDSFRGDVGLPPRRETMLHNHHFPSKSTISTIPGTFDARHKKDWSPSNGSPSSAAQNSNGTHNRRVATVSPPSEKEREAYNAIRRLVGKKKRKKEKKNDKRLDDSSKEEEEEEWSYSGDSLGQSRNSTASTAFQLVAQGVSKIGDVGNAVVTAGAEVGTVTKNGLFKAGDVGFNHIQKAGQFGVKNVVNVAGNAKGKVALAAELGVANMNTLRHSAAAVVPLHLVLGHVEGHPLEAGFVVFKDLYSTQAALQMLHYNAAEIMRVEEAPGPEEIYWKNVGMPGSAQQTGRLLSLAATVALCLFWTIPVSFISSLTEINSLKEEFPSIEEAVLRFPGLELILALIAPLLLLILQDVMLPECLKWFATWEGHISSSAMEAAVFLKYASFVLIQTFFISALSGSLTSQITNMLNEPDMFVDFLANALPAQSNFFLQLLIVTMAVTMGMEMTRVSPLGMAVARRYFGPNLTEEERSKRWKGLSPLEDPREFEHANLSGTVVLYFMVFFVYATLAPISSFFLYPMFVFMEAGFRYNFYHNYPPKPDSGGKYWLKFLHIFQGCMVVAQLTLMGFLLLKQSFFAVPFMVPLLIFTILFTFYLNNYQLHVSTHLPTGKCVEIDNRYRLADHNFIKGQYLQPCLREAQSDEIFEIIE